MRSSLPAFNQLQLSFPQLEAKDTRGEGGRTKMQHTNSGQYNTEQNVNRRTEGKRHENKELFYQMCRMSKVCKFVCTNDLWS